MEIDNLGILIKDHARLVNENRILRAEVDRLKQIIKELKHETILHNEPTRSLRK